jgi:hypothetical protein
MEVPTSEVVPEDAYACGSSLPEIDLGDWETERPLRVCKSGDPNDRQGRVAAMSRADPLAVYSTISVAKRRICCGVSIGEAAPGGRRQYGGAGGIRTGSLLHGGALEPRRSRFHSAFHSHPHRERRDLFPPSGFIPLSAMPAPRIWTAVRVPVAGDPSGVPLAQPQRASRRQAQRVPVDAAEAVASVANAGSRLLSSSNTCFNHQPARHGVHRHGDRHAMCLVSRIGAGVSGTC